VLGDVGADLVERGGQQVGVVLLERIDSRSALDPFEQETKRRNLGGKIEAMTRAHGLLQESNGFVTRWPVRGVKPPKLPNDEQRLVVIRNVTTPLMDRLLERIDH